MRLIQIILLAALSLAFLVYFVFLRSIGRDRLLALALFSIVVLAVVFPDGTTAVANMVGVGRGTDLSFYLFSVFILFAVMVLHLKIRRMENSITQLTRELALRDARSPAAQGTSTN